MANDVTLVLRANNAEHVNKMREAQKETQKVYDTAEKGSVKQRGLIEKEIQMQKQLALQQSKARNIDSLKQYNQLLDDSKKRLQALEQAGIKTEKSGNSLLKSVGTWALGFASVTTAVRFFKEILESTDTLSDKFKATLNGWKEGFSSMARAIANNDFKDFFKNVKAAVQEGQRYTETEDKIGDAERAAKLRIDDRVTAILKLRVVQNSALKSDQERAEAGKEAAQLLIDNSEDLLLIAKARYDNELQNAAFRAGFQGKEIERGKQLVRLYLQEEPVLMRQIALGEKYNDLVVQKGILEKKVTSQTGILYEDALNQVQAKIDAMGSEAVEYGRIAGLKNIVDAQRDAIVAKSQAIGEAERERYNLRVLSRIDALGKKEVKSTEQTEEEKLKIRMKYQELSLKLLDDYDKSNIESLTGVKKLSAIRDFGLKQLAEFRKQLASFGTVTAEQDALFQLLGENIWKEFMKGMKKEGKLTSEQKKSVSKALSEGYEITERDQEDIVVKIKGAFTKIRNELQPSKIRGSDTLDKEKKSIWSLLGIDPDSDEGKEQINALKEAASTIMGIIDEVNQKRVDEAQRRRELLDTQISEIQSELETEAELQKAGFASNVDAKRKELAELKKQRDTALIKEEEAIKKQQAWERTTQAISLATSAANILKSLTASLGPVGLILAVGAIAGLYKLFADAKAKATEVTTYAGGGLVGGRSHSQGGTMVEAEKGEFITNKKQTTKFKSLLEAINNDDRRMIFNSFNKLSPELLGGTTVNNVVVENDGPNKRLDKVNEQLTRLNRKQSREEIIELGNQTIHRKGNVTRTIRR
jgi:hypothetical protein